MPVFEQALWRGDQADLALKPQGLERTTLKTPLPPFTSLARFHTGDGLTALMNAAENGTAATVAALLDAGVRVENQ